MILIKHKTHLLSDTIRYAGLRFESILPLMVAMIAVCMWPHPAAAADGGAGTLTDVANAFKTTSAGWISTALDYARHLFFLLVAIELAWTAVTYVLQRDSLSETESEKFGGENQRTSRSLSRWRRSPRTNSLVKPNAWFPELIN